MSSSKSNLLKISPRKPPAPELWGGVECTYNRVGNIYYDQIELSGHARRLSDFKHIASLGIRTLRMGLLWERHEACDPEWHWADSRLEYLQELGIRPIAGLMHHGSGPSHTDLLDSQFPEKLAAYASKVAERYPWIDAYTPVNEPHTTARFSALYGVWYPHHMSRESYLRSVLQQLKGSVLSMKAIRSVRSDAKFIQTEDVGRITGTAELRPTWELLSLRRWMTFDLLCGLVDRHHPLFPYMRAAQISEEEILWFAENPCPPDVIGINYYVTSDRYLDHRVDLFPESFRSAEGNFVDLEMVRSLPRDVIGFGPLLREAWQRYKIPMAITEVHLGCTPEEQIRWIAESWSAASQARLDGVDCVAVTAWSLLGSCLWNELVTRDNGHYEPGVFAVQNSELIYTELGKVVRQMAAGKTPQHPALSQRGWWHHPNRICMPSSWSAAA